MSDSMIPYTLSEYRKASSEQKLLYWEWRAKAKEDDKRMIAKIERMKPENKARIAAYQKAHMEKPENKARIAAREKAYREKPGVKARIAACNAEYRARHADSIKAKKAAWHAKPEVKAKKKKRDRERYMAKKKTGGNTYENNLLRPSAVGKR